MPIYDCIIVGAGLAGSTAAYHLSRSGHRVLMVDAATLPRHKPCGGGVSPQIAEWFDYFIVQPAQRQGATLWDGTKAKEIEAWGDTWRVHTSQGSVEGKFLIAVDGARGSMAKWLGFTQRRYRLAAALEIEPRLVVPDEPVIHFDLGPLKQGYVWNFPKANGYSIGGGVLRSGNQRRQNLRPPVADYATEFDLDASTVQPSRSTLPMRIIGAIALMVGAGACSFNVSALAPVSSPSSPGLGRLAQAQTADDWAQMEQDILAVQNQARQDPASLIPLLEARLAAMNNAGQIVNGCGRNCNIVTHEGKAAVQEAIAFLRQQAALSPLDASDQVAQAAQAHAQDQANGAMGHVGSDGSSPGDRIDRAGALNTGSGENIAYGSTTGQEVILDLIVDDGVPDRGHRVNIFSPQWTHTGAGCGPHEGYGVVCVINYITFSPQFTVVHRGTVVLESLTLAGQNLLGGPLAPGETKAVTLRSDQCQADLDLQMQGYQPLRWPDLSLCGATLTVDAGNGFEMNY